MGGPLVSIVTPAYNQASFIAETIDSVLFQDYDRIEYRVINDGSTDSTEQVLEGYNGRIIWTSQANRGQTATINTGWKSAAGDILAWLNSDDTLLPGAVRTIVEYFRDHPDVGIVYGDTVFTDASGRTLGGQRAKRPFEYANFVRTCENPIPQPSAFVRRRVVDDIGLLDPSYFYFMDWDYWLRAGLMHSIAYFPVQLSTYRLHALSNSVSALARAAPELEYMYRKFFTTARLPPEIRALEREAIASMYITSAAYFLHGGAWRSSVRNICRAMRVNPRLCGTLTGLHKITYCVLGRLRPYQTTAKGLRGLRYRLSRVGTRRTKPE